MESPSAEDRRLVEAREDSTSVDHSSPVTDDPRLSPSEPNESDKDVPRGSEDNALPEDSTSRVSTQPDSSSFEVSPRLRDEEKDSSIESKPPEVAECSPDSSAISSSSSDPVDRANVVEDNERETVDGAYEDNFFADERPVASSSGDSTPSRKRPAGDFLPMNAEIKRIGIEISDEQAQQLKNDVRRLSPVLVSLRERTLGEISLTSDSGLFEDEVQPPRLEETAESLTVENADCLHSTGDTSGAILTAAGLSRIDSTLREAPNLMKNSPTDAEESAVTGEAKENSADADRQESRPVEDLERVVEPPEDSTGGVVREIVDYPSTILCNSPNDFGNVRRELVIVLSRVDHEDADSKVTASGDDATRDRRIESVESESEGIVDGSLACVLDGASLPRNVAERTGEDDHEVEAARGRREEGQKTDDETGDCGGKDNPVLVGDYCLSPKYLGNDQLTRKSPKVVIERTLESSASSSKITPETTIERSEALQRLDLDCVRKTLADSLIESNEESNEDNDDDDDDDDDDVDENDDDDDDDEVPIDRLATSDDSLRSESPNGVAEATSDLRESLDTETETETVSDTSELTSMNSVNLSDCVEPTNGASSCPETDSLPSDEVPSEIMTRLEPERPEAFTEDSAESLALATGARDEVRSDGSDSGLGSEIPGDPGPAPAPESDSETSFLDRIPDDILTDKDKAVNQLEAFVPDAGTSGTQQPLPQPQQQQQQQQPQQQQQQQQQPQQQQQQQQQQINLPSFPSPPKSSLKRRLTDCMEGEPSPKRINTEDPMRKKRNIQFDAVTVYYFPRAQGFTCVPSQGGSTLGMSATHTHAERFSLAEHATEQRRIHRARLAQLRSERAANCVTEAASSSEDPSDDTDEEPSDTEELDIDSYYFLQPVPTWQRRALLRAAGVRRIDAVEKDDCRDIRASREHCGCGCKGYCDPESCPCSRANVKCQVDRAGFPCGCSRDGCANSSGRIEFNPVRVRTHFIHTLMRLQLEKKQRDEDRTDHESSANDRPARGPMREPPASLGNPMDHPSAITGDPASCINVGGFTTLRYESHETASTPCQPVVHAGREDSLDLYAIRDDCYPGEPEAVGVEGVQSTQRKLHPEFGQAFQPFPGQQPGVSFPQGAYQDYQGYQTLASTSRSQFQPQFQAAPPPANAGFSHYAYGQDPGVMQTSCQPHPGAPRHVYENSFQQEDPPGSQQQYTNLNSVQPMNAVVQQMGKLEPFSELLAGRYSYYGDVEPQPLGSAVGYQRHNGDAKTEPDKSQPIVAQTVEPAAGDCDENFGEIIKKSMVETVSA